MVRKKSEPSTTTPAPDLPIKKVRGRPFAKGEDSRRGVSTGRPKTFTALRELAQAIASAPSPEDGKTKLEKIITEWSESPNPILQKAFIELGYGKTPEAPVEEQKPQTSPLKDLPADKIAPAFFEAYRDIKAGRHTEYVFHGGRGSTKSSFIALVIIWLIVNNPLVHALILRQVGNTLRDSVYGQLIWAINELELNDLFKTTVNPMEIEYLATGQKLYFRGADDPDKLKSIKPKFGAISIVWMEEFDTFRGIESVRKIEQSVLRGGDRAWIFKSFNPPRTMASFANQYIRIPKESQYQHKSDYTTVPKEWLGEPWISQAEHLRKVNPLAFEHEYLGVPNFAGGMVFGNVTIRKIEDAEIAEFDRPLSGLDWGFYPDPAHYVKCHYDAARHRLFIYGEVRRWKCSNEQLYAAIKEHGDYEDWELLIADSAEPKSVADFRSYGATARGAEKGKESVAYSMKWLQSLAEIIIDQERCPASAKEFMEYEYERTKDDEIISAFPDANNHAIDAVRYSTNHIWKRRGS